MARWPPKSISSHLEKKTSAGWTPLRSFPAEATKSETSYGGAGQAGATAVAELLAIPECREVVMATFSLGAKSPNHVSRCPTSGRVRWPVGNN
jgi:hypothetical protein